MSLTSTIARRRAERAVAAGRCPECEAPSGHWDGCRLDPKPAPRWAPRRKAKDLTNAW
jgi:hypothetical protein